MINHPDLVTRNCSRDCVTRAWLSTMQEPAALLRTNGELVAANRQFQDEVCTFEAGTQLADLVLEEPSAVRKYLRACSTTSSPLIGALHSAANGKMTCRGNRLPIENEVFVVLRLHRPDARFRRLSDSVRDLNLLLRKREHEKAQLAEALSDRAVLYRELQHRVKNNLQMLSGLLHAATADQDDPTAKAALQDTSRRFAAVASAHQFLYHLDSLETTPAEPLIRQIQSSVTRVSERDAEVELFVGDLQLPNDLATPLALIFNELLTNALKYSRNPNAGLKIRVSFQATAGVAELIVHDNGETFVLSDGEKRGSGLGLVRGLARQLRGKLTIDLSAGVRVGVVFPLRQAAIGT